MRLSTSILYRSLSFLSFSPCWYFCVLEIIWLTIILGRHRIHICLILLSRYIPVSNCSIACMQTALFSQTKRKTRLIELPNEDFASGRCLNVNLSYGPLACSPFNARVLAILQLLWTCLPLIFNVMQYQSWKSPFSTVVLVLSPCCPKSNSRVGAKGLTIQ